MYLCPHCHEEIPDRVKRNTEDCPFCHEAWPPEPVQSEPEEPETAQDGWSAQAAGMSGDSAHPIPPVEEPKSKAKMLLLIGIVILLLGGGGAGAYFAFFRGEDKAASDKAITVKVGDEEVSIDKIYGEEFEEMVAWHNEVRRTILEFLASRCDPYRKSGFSFSSQLVKREKFVSTTKRVSTLDLEIRQEEGEPVELDNFNWFNCPGILAYVHKEHEMSIGLGFSITERTLGTDIRRAVVEIKGGRFVSGKGKYVSSWDLGRTGLLSFHGLNKTEAKEHPWILELNRGRVDRDNDDSFNLEGIPFKRTATGRLRHKSFLVGQWEAGLSTNTFKNLLETWSGACSGMRQNIRSVNKKYAEEEDKFKIPLLKQKAIDVTAELCGGLEKISKSMDPWDEDGVNEGRTQIIESLNQAGLLLRTPLMELGKKINNDMKLHHWCGDYRSEGAECK